MPVSFNDITNMANVMSANRARTQAAETATARTGLAERDLGLRERAQGADEKQLVIQNARKALSGLEKSISQIAGSGLLETDPERAKALAEPFKNQMKAILTAGGADPGTAEQMAAARVNAALERATMAAMAEKEGGAAAAKTNATEAGLGIPGMAGKQARADLAATHAGTDATRAGASTDALATQGFVNLQTGDTQSVMLSDPNARERVSGLSSRGYVPMGKPTIAAATAADLGGIPESKDYGNAAQRAAGQGEIQSLAESRRNISRLIKDIKANPGRYAILGSVSKGVETLGGMLKDLGVTLGGRDQLAAASDYISSIAEKLGADSKSEFDTIAQTDPIRTQLIFDLAKAWVQKGRPQVIALELAREATELRGLTSSDNVLSKMEEINRILSAAQDDAKARLSTLEGGGKITGRAGGQSKADPNPVLSNGKKLSEVSPEEVGSLTTEELEMLAPK